jgi:hypothetical protein
MKIHTFTVIDISTGEVIADTYHEYAGKLAKAGTGGGAKSQSAPSYVIPGLLPSIGSAATNSIIGPNMGNPATVPYVTSSGVQGQYTVPKSLTDINMDRAVQQIRGGYGARGLANSGIAIQGEQNAIGQLALQGQQQDQTALTNLLAAGTGSASTQKQSTGMSVICTELHAQGILDTITYKADCEYSKMLPREAIEGYHMWAKPVVRLMRKSKVFTRLITPLALAWATEMRHRWLNDCKGSAIGTLLLTFGVPGCVWLARHKQLTLRSQPCH